MEVVQHLRRKSLEELSRAYLLQVTRLGYSPIEVLNEMKKIIEMSFPPAEDSNTKSIEER